MSTKKWITLCIFVLTLIVALGSAYVIARREFSGDVPASEASVQATATPLPAPTEELLPPKVALAAPQADAAFRAAIATLPNIECSETEIANLSDVGDFDAAVVYIASSDDAARAAEAVEAGLPIVAYNPHGIALPDSVNEVRFAPTVPATAEESMETAIAYPPHDTPVRMFGVFASADGEAAAVWNAAVDAGRVLSKGTFGLEPDGSMLEIWISEKLQAFYPGMVDAAFVETPAQALLLAEAMRAAQRDDFEIFTIGTDAALSAVMAENPRLLPTTVQIDHEAGAAACIDALERVLAGGDVEDTVIGE